jgi:AAA domain
MNADAPIPSVAECIQFMRFWTGVTEAPHITLIAIAPDFPIIVARTFSPDDADAASEWIGYQQRAERNIYFQPNETPPGCRHKPAKHDMVAALCRFADIDPDDENYPLAEERDRLARLAARLSADPTAAPTAIIDSGNGLQSIWAVTREQLDDAATAKVETETQAVEAALGAGGTHNIDRLLRLPGTVNYPNGKKRRLGRGVSRARLIFSAPNLYQPSQAANLAAHLAAQLADTGFVRPKPAKAAASSTADDAAVTALMQEMETAGADKITQADHLTPDLQERLNKATAFRPRLADRWAGMVDDLTEDGLDDSHSAADFSLAAMLKAAHFSHLDAALILCAFPHGKANNDEWPNAAMRLRHVARSVARSYNPKPPLERYAQTGSDFGDVARFRLDAMTEGAPPPRRFLLKPLMPLGTVGLLFGPGGVGKSLVALDLCLRCAMRLRLGDGNPTEVIGPLGGVIPADGGGATVFLTLEDDRAEIHRRTASLDPGGDRHDAPCYVIPAIDQLPNFDPTLVTAEGRVAVLTAFAQTGLDALLEDIARAAGHPVRLLVLDPAGDFLDVDENDATHVKPLMRRLRVVAAQHDCTIILLGHVAKSMDVDGLTMRGSSAWVANSRFAYALWRPTDEDARKLARKLKVPADGLVWGNLVKANHAEAPIGQKRIYLRDPRSGRLEDLTVQAQRGPTDDVLLEMLVTSCAEYAAAGLPFAYSGVAGLWNGRADLPEPLAMLTKKRLEGLGTLALDNRLLVKARTTESQGAPKYLDVPDGPLSKGVGVDMPQGSRRKALARLKEGTDPPPDADAKDNNIDQ